MANLYLALKIAKLEDRNDRLRKLCNRAYYFINNHESRSLSDEEEKQQWLSDYKMENVNG